MSRLERPDSVGQGAVDLRLADSARRAEAAEILEKLLGTSPTLPTDPYALARDSSRPRCCRKRS